MTSVPLDLGMLTTQTDARRRTHGGGRAGDRVRDLIEEAILAGALQPGAHVNADGLAKQLGVSHIPVREALRSLAAEGWVDIRPHQGAFVRPRSEHELADLFEMRLLLEAKAGGLAAERRAAEQLEQLEEVLCRQRGAPDDVEFARMNAEFHGLVADCSQNQLLAEAVRALSLRARLYCSAVVPRRREKSVREHAAIVEAIRHRDVTSAESLSYRHVATTRADVLAFMREG